MNYLKIGKSEELKGYDKKIYRALEILPGFLSWFTLLFLLVMSYFYPVFIAFFIIAFDIYWLLLVIFLGIHLLISYKKMKINTKMDWKEKCEILSSCKIKLSFLPTGFFSSSAALYCFK